MNTTARTGTTVVPNRPMTEAQRTYIKDLLSKVNTPAVAEPIRAALNTHAARNTLTIEVASAFITSLKAVIGNQAVPALIPAPAPIEAVSITVAPTRTPYPVVAEGRYAVEMNGVLRFYNVTKNDAGTRTFVKRYMSDTLVRVNGGEQVAALRTIEADPQAAREAYARETTRCWTCGRRLTDPESIAAGQGAECRAKAGMGR